MNTNLPRGLRNHNPGNIRRNAEHWQGEIQPSTDPAFKQFADDAYGYRALLKLLANYITLHGCTTPRRVIARWAPPPENDTARYLAHVCRWSGITPDEPLRPGDQRQMCLLASAMSRQENGIPARPDDVALGWKLLHGE